MGKQNAYVIDQIEVFSVYSHGRQL